MGRLGGSRHKEAAAFPRNALAVSSPLLPDYSFLAMTTGLPLSLWESWMKTKKACRKVQRDLM